MEKENSVTIYILNPENGEKQVLTITFREPLLAEVFNNRKGWRINNANEKNIVALNGERDPHTMREIARSMGADKIFDTCFDRDERELNLF